MLMDTYVIQNKFVLESCQLSTAADRLPAEVQLLAGASLCQRLLAEPTSPHSGCVCHVYRVQGTQEGAWGPWVSCRLLQYISGQSFCAIAKGSRTCYYGAHVQGPFAV